MNQQDRTRERHQLKQLSLCVALALPALAMAQQQTDTAPDTLPEVVVKAQKQRDTTEGTGSYTTNGKSRTATPLGLSLRDTPQSVSVVTQQRIEDQGMLTVTDAVKYVTGVSVNQYETNRGQFTARGFNINALMIDGVPTTWEQPWSSGEIISSLATYDRVEVVRGATGLTTGAGDPSAAINLVRKRASSKEFTGKVEADIGSWNQRRVMGDLSTALNEAKTLRARVVAEHSERDSWVDNLKNKNQSVYATLEADVGRNTLLSAGFGRQENKTKGPMWGGLPTWYADGSDTRWDRSASTAAKWTRWDSNYDNAFVSIEHRFDNDWKVKGSYNQGDRTADSYLLYLSGAPSQTTGAGMWASPGSYKVHTKQEDVGLQASGPFKVLGRTHELALGYSYSRQNFLAQNRAGTGGAVANFNTWDGSYAEPAWGPLSYYGEGTVTQEAAYGATRLSLTDRLKLILGARLTNYQRSGDQYNTEPFTMTFKRELTPYAGVIFDLNETYSLYASHTDIFQPQQKRDVDGNYLTPITGKGTEAGIKAEFLEGRLNASAAVFRIRQDNLAQSAGVTIPGTSPAETAYVAVEGATSTGFELELSGELARGWNGTVGYSQFKAEDAKGVDVNSIYPRKLLRLFTTYQLPGAFSAVTIGGGVNWQSSTYTYVTTLSRNIDQGAYALVDLMARYAINKDLSAQINVNNVFDKTYYGMFAAYNQFTYGAPRNATLSLQYKF